MSGAEEVTAAAGDEAAEGSGSHAGGGAADVRIKAYRISGEALGALSLRSSTLTSDVAQRVRKLAGWTCARLQPEPSQKRGAPPQADSSALPTVLIGLRVLPDDSTTSLCECIDGESEVIAYVFDGCEIQVKVTSADGRFCRRFDMPGSHTVRDVARALEDAEEIPMPQQQLLVDATVARPGAMLAVFRRQPLAMTLRELPEVSVISVPMKGELGEELRDAAMSQFVVMGATRSHHGFHWNIAVGSHLMMKGCPCRVFQVTCSRAGKCGHPKAYVWGRGVFNGVVHEELWVGGSFEVPLVTHKQYQLLSADAESGLASLLTKHGVVKEDVDLPTVTAWKHDNCRHEQDQRVQELMLAYLEEGSLVTVKTVCALGIEKIMDVQASNDGSQ